MFYSCSNYEICLTWVWTSELPPTSPFYTCGVVDICCPHLYWRDSQPQTIIARINCADTDDAQFNLWVQMLRVNKWQHSVQRNLLIIVGAVWNSCFSLLWVALRHVSLLTTVLLECIKLAPCSYCNTCRLATELYPERTETEQLWQLYLLCQLKASYVGMTDSHLTGPLSKQSGDKKMTSSWMNDMEQNGNLLGFVDNKKSKEYF